MSNQTELKRLNFFTGLFTTAEDWQQEQRYHLEKRRLHLRGLHSPGIIPDVGGGCKVKAKEGLKVEVSSGAALDTEGNLIYLSKASPQTISPPASLPATVYVVLELGEKQTEYRVNTEDPDFTGNAYCTEEARVSCVDQAPDNKKVLELARINLQPGVTEIKDAGNQGQPGANEIDMRNVLRAGARDVTRDAQLEALHTRLSHLHDYHLAKQQRHNRGLFKAGIMRGILDEFKVVPVGGLTVHVQPGVALDGAGNEVYLDNSLPLTLDSPSKTTRVYIAVSYQDSFTPYLADVNKVFPGTYRTAQVGIGDTVPDNHTWIELAQLDLTAGAAEVRLPADPGHPRRDEIDRRYVEWAKARAVAAPKLPTAQRERIAQIMRDKRRDFAALAMRFPVPSATDVRQAALNLETLARNDSLRAENLTEVLAMLAALEQDVGQEIGNSYKPVVARPEYKDYAAAVAALRDALYAGEHIDTILNCQAAITMAARELAEVIFQAPTADAGPDQSVTSADDETIVTLDASRSKAFDGQKIFGVVWVKER